MKRQEGGGEGKKATRTHTHAQPPGVHSLLCRTEAGAKLDAALVASYLLYILSFSLSGRKNCIYSCLLVFEEGKSRGMAPLSINCRHSLIRCQFHQCYLRAFFV